MQYSNFIIWLMSLGWMQASIAGFCLGIGFVIPALAWLCLFGIVWLIHMVTVSQSFTQVAIYGMFVWFIKSALSIVWFYDTYPIEWVGIQSGVTQIIVITFYLATSALWLSSGGALFAITARALQHTKQLSSMLWFLLLPFVWLVAELGGALVFSLCTAGPGSLLQPYFSFGMMGYLLALTPFGVSVAGVAAVYGLSFVLVAGAVVCYVLLQNNPSLIWKGGSVLIAGAVLYGVTVPKTNSEVGVTVIAIDTQFSTQLLRDDAGKEQKADVVSDAVKTAVSLEPTFVVLPEDSRYLANTFDSSEPQQSMAYFGLVQKNTETVVIDSGRFQTTDGKTVLRASIFDGQSKTLWQYDKQYLVPQGEYVPYLYQALLRLIGFGEAIEAVAKQSSYQPGPLLQSNNTPAYLPAVMFCFESVRPDAAIALQAITTAPFIVHPISHGWFHSSEILRKQLDTMLVIQARVSGVPIVSAGNMSVGKLYLPNGEIVEGEVVATGTLYQLRKYSF